MRRITFRVLAITAFFAILGMLSGEATALTATSTVINSSVNPSIYGNSVVFTIDVSPWLATGTVTLKDGSTTVATATLTKGAATITTAKLTAGTHQLTAVYGGNATYATSTSAVLRQTVNKATPTVTLASATNPSAFGSPVKFTVTLVPSTATGTVTFKDGTTTLGTGTISNGTATYTTTALAVGSHSITASYPGDANDLSNTTSALTQTVNKATPTVTTASSANPSIYGSSVKFTATINPPGATGTITFTDGSTTLGTGTISSGSATYTISTLTAGAHSIAASYSGDNNYNSTASTALTQTVNKASTTAAIASSANPSTYGSSVAFTATVTPATATGTVTFTDGNTTIGTGTISGGIATFSTTALTAGSHSIAAAYSGDTNYNGSNSSTLAQTVNKANTTLSLASSPNPTGYGSPVTFTATVTPATATGTVTFKDGSTTIGTGTISGGTATYSTSTLAVASHAITASYGGDANYNTSASTALTQTVNKAATTVTLSSSLNPSAYSSPVTITATVGPATATGTVTFTDGSTTIGTGTISGGIATYSTSTLAVASHSIAASYGGDANDATSASAPLTEIVNKEPTTVTLTSSVNPSIYSSPVTFTATVAPATATGTVTFTDGSTTLGTGTLSNGIASLSTATLTAGSHSIAASYGGDTNDSNSSSTTLTQTVNKENTTVALTSSANPSAYGGPVTFTATVTPAAATGTVTFTDGSTTLGTGTISGGIATYTTSALAVASHSIAASYSGDSNNNSSASTTLTQTVNKASTSVTMVSSVNPSAYGGPVTFTATVTPSTATGTVTFIDGSTTVGTGTISGGIATYSTSTLAVASHSITASYGGDSNYLTGTSTTLTQTVNKASTAVTLASSQNPSAYGAPVTFTATVTPSTATGTVTFTDGSTPLGTGTISGGIASYSSSGLAVASHSITASYGGDTNYTISSTSTALTQTVNKANATVGLVSSLNPSAYSALVTFTATVSPATATGTVTFTDGSATLGTGTINGGIATYSTTALAVASHSITASYGGDTNYNTSASTTLTQTVNKASSTVALVSSLNPSTFSASVTFTATVAPATATGTVTFTDGSTTLGTGTISGGVATYSTTTLAVASHSITASYSGDANYNTSASVALTQTVNKASTSVSLVSSLNPSPYGSPVTFTATVAPATATGTVTFTDGSTTIGTVTISNGTASYTSSTLAVTSHSISASYGGDSSYNISTSTVLTQTVNKANTTVTISSSVNPLGFGSPVTFTATVTPSTATGTVTFTDGGMTLGTGTISGGVASYTTSALSVGSHSIAASYGGDANYNISASTALAETVNKANTTGSLTSTPNPTTYGSLVTFTATVTPATATGTVTFTDGSTALGSSTLSNGTATYSVSTLSVGSHPVTATYGGDANDAGGTSAILIQTINKDSTTVALASPVNPSAYGSPVTFTATMTPAAAAGTVTFTDGSTTLGAGTISNGIATYTTSTLAVGPHSIAAAYGGDANDSTSTSSPLTQTVNKANSTVTLASSANPAAFGSPVAFTATLTPTMATGTMTFTDGSTTLGTGTVNSGVATYSTSTLAAASHSITATYGGDTNYNSSASTTLTQTINPLPQVSTASLSAGTAGTSYTAMLAATSGTLPYSWSLSTGNLPDGLSLNPSTGAITGTPTTEGNSTFTVEVTDANQLTATQPLSIAVSAVVTALSPGFGPVGTNVAISGIGFGTSAGTVTFNGVAATSITSWSATSIVAAVPTGAGARKVVVTGGGVSSNGISFLTTTDDTQANLNASRYRHNATTLNNGQILVAGGVNCTSPGSCTYLNSAELYNPATSGFTNTGAMANPRSAPAVLLSSGKMLTAGGYSCDGSGNCSSLNSAEIYDPNAGTFSNAGTMTTPRSGHTMTLLGNGTVLIAGGENCTSATSCSALQSAEIYDPNARTFTLTSNSMTAARFGASAVLLNSGSVLIAGGFDGTNLPASAEIYNPAAGIGFTGTGPRLSVPRFDASATLLNNGRVLVAGGSTCGLPGCPTNASEIYDPTANMFNVVTGGMIVPRFHHTATLLTNGQVVVAGGYSSCISSCSGEASTELFDPVAGAFTASAPVATALACHTTTLLADGTALLIGGINSGLTLASDQLYLPASLTPPGLASIAIAPGSSVLTPGQSEFMVATSTFNDGSTQILQSVIWSSSNPAVAAISNSTGSSGIAIAQSAGTTTLTATVGAVNSSASLTVLNQASAALTSSADPSTFGSPVTFTATVTPATAAGTVTFTDGNTTLGTGTLSNGTATYSTSALAVGSHSITASYGGDTNDTTSTSTTLIQNVNQASTAVTLASSANPSAYGTLTMFTATVTPATATGTVTFSDGSTTLGTGTISSGIATYSTSSLAVGSHSITASYSGDTNDLNNTSPTLTLTVNQAATTVTPASSLNPSSYSALVAFTATVTPSTATGTVTFMDGATTLGTGTVSGGIATYNTSMLAVGSHSITASYGGDANYSGSTSTLLLTQTVNKTNTSVALASSLNPSAYGSSTAVTATVTPATAMGTVTFSDGSTTLGTGTISSGSATYNTSALAVGSHSITASYSGDTNDGTGTSTTLTQTVNQASATVSLGSSANPASVGSPVTFTAVVAPAAATGTVTFTDGSTTLGMGMLSSGTATYSTSTLAAGPHSIVASYSGDANDSSGVSLALTETINLILQITTTSLPAGIAGTSYSMTLAATGGAPPYTWAIVSGTLASGLLLNASTGAITGTPMVETTSYFTVQVTDAANTTAIQPLSIVVTPIMVYSARTDNCVNGTQSGCISGKSTGEVGSSLIFQEGVNDPIPAGFAPTTILSGSCPSGFTPSSYPAYCPAPMNSTATDPDFGSYLVIATDENTNSFFSNASYKASWNMGSDGDWDAFSWDETLLLAKNSGGGATILNINPGSIHAKTCGTSPCVNSTGINTAANGGGDSTHLAHGGAWTFSRVPSEPHVVYEQASVPTQVNQLAITSSIATPGTGSLIRSVYVDFTSDNPVPCSVMESAAPGNPTTYSASWTGSFQVADDGTISYGMTGGYDWAPSWVVTPIDTFILPTVANAGKNGYQATAVSGNANTSAVEPTWCQTTGCSVVDGGVTWTNIGKLAGQGPGFDIVIYRPPTTSAPGCTRINTRLGKIYRGTGNTAPAGYMTTNDEVVCTRAGTYPAPCRLPDLFTLHEVEQAQNGQYVEFSPTGGEGAGPTSTSAYNYGTLSCQISNTAWAGAWSASTTYALHNVVSYGGWFYTSNASNNTNHTPPTPPATSTWWTVSEAYCGSYFFDTTSTSVAPLTDWVHGQGHAASGYLHKYYNGKYWSMLFSLPVINGVLNPDTPILQQNLPCDDHGTYRNAGLNDQPPMFTVTDDVPAWPTRYRVPNGSCYEELCAFDPGGSGLAYRFGHTFNTGSSASFQIQSNIGDNSPLGDLIAFGTDMMGRRASNATPSAQCNNLRAMYQPSPSGSVNYNDTMIDITTDNIYQAVGCPGQSGTTTCTEGATLPNWSFVCSTQGGYCTSNGLLTGTSLDGNVIWENMGKNTCRGDIVILDTLGAHPAP